MGVGVLIAVAETANGLKKSLKYGSVPEPLRSDGYSWLCNWKGSFILAKKLCTKRYLSMFTADFSGHWPLSSISGSPRVGSPFFVMNLIPLSSSCPPVFVFKNLSALRKHRINIESSNHPFWVASGWPLPLLYGPRRLLREGLVHLFRFLKSIGWPPTYARPCGASNLSKNSGEAGILHFGGFEYLASTEDTGKNWHLVLLRFWLWLHILIQAAGNIWKQKCDSSARPFDTWVVK